MLVAARAWTVAGSFALAVAACDGSLAMPPPDPDAGVPSSTSDAGVQAEGFRVLDGKSGAPVSSAALWNALGAAQVVCLGEQHDDPDHHAFQAAVVKRLTSAAPLLQRRDATGFEMFQVPFQGYLDQYAAGQIDEATMLTRTEWDKRWGFAYADYRPIVQGAVAGGAPLLALNAPLELTQKIAKGGIASLTAEERAQLPAAIDVTNAAHRAWFTNAIQEGHGAPTGDAFERIYAVQVVWDTTMADVSSRWLAAQAPVGAQVIVIAGNGHCHALGIPLRLGQRGVGAASVHLTADDAVEIDAAVREGLSDYVVAIERGFFARP